MFLSNDKNSDFLTRRNYGSSNDSDYSSNMIDSPFNTKPKLLRSNSKPKITVVPMSTSNINKNTVVSNNNQDQYKQQNTNNKQQANNVEIVGKKLMSNNNNNTILTTTATTTVPNLIPPPFPSPTQTITATSYLNNNKTDTIVNTNWKNKAAALRSKNF